MILRDLEQKIIQDINDSNLSVDAIYFVMRSLMREIEEQYFSYCQQEDALKQAKITQEETELSEPEEEY